MPDRFFCPELPVEGRLTLDRDESRHLGRVRRLGPGDVVEVFDGRGFASLAKVVSLERDQARLQLVGAPLPDRLAPCFLTLATAVPKGERFDWLVEKATELGVVRLVPLVTERSVVDPREAKLERLRRTVIEASKQCGRNRLMVVDRLSPWELFMAMASDSLKLIAHPGGEAAAGWPRVPRGGSVSLAVGPEGGFTESEVEKARREGWRLVSLGATLLRIETAGLAGCSMIQALCEGNVE